MSPRMRSINDAARHNPLASRNLSGVNTENSSHQTRCHQLVKWATDRAEIVPPAEPGNNDLEPAAVIGSKCGGVIARRRKRTFAKVSGVTHRRRKHLSSAGDVAAAS